MTQRKQRTGQELMDELAAKEKIRMIRHGRDHVVERPGRNPFGLKHGGTLRYIGEDANGVILEHAGRGTHQIVSSTNERAFFSAILKNVTISKDPIWEETLRVYYKDGFAAAKKAIQNAVDSNTTTGWYNEILSEFRANDQLRKELAKPKPHLSRVPSVYQLKQELNQPDVTGELQRIRANRGGARLHADPNYWLGNTLVRDQLEAREEALTQARQLNRQVQSYRRDLGDIRRQAQDLVTPEVEEYWNLTKNMDKGLPDEARQRLGHLKQKLRRQFAKIEVLSGQYEALGTTYKELFQNGLVEKQRGIHSFQVHNPWEIFNAARTDLDRALDPASRAYENANRITALEGEVNLIKELQEQAREEVSLRGGPSELIKPRGDNSAESLTQMHRRAKLESIQVAQDEISLKHSEEAFTEKASPAGGRQRLRLAAHAALTESNPIALHDAEVGKMREYFRKLGIERAYAPAKHRHYRPIKRKAYADSWRNAFDEKHPVKIRGSAVQYNVTSIVDDIVNLRAVHVDPNDLVLRLRYTPTVENLRRIAHTFNKVREELAVANSVLPDMVRLGDKASSITIAMDGGAKTHVINNQTLLRVLTDISGSVSAYEKGTPTIKFAEPLEKLIRVHAPWAERMLGRDQLVSTMWLAAHEAAQSQAAHIAYLGYPEGRKGSKIAEAKAFNAISDAFLKAFHREAFDKKPDNLIGALVNQLEITGYVGTLTEGEFIDAVGRTRKQLDLWDMDEGRSGWSRAPHNRWLKYVSDEDLRRGFQQSRYRYGNISIEQVQELVAADDITDISGKRTLDGAIREANRENRLIMQEDARRGSFNVGQSHITDEAYHNRKYYRGQYGLFLDNELNAGRSRTDAMFNATKALWKQEGFQSLSVLYGESDYITLLEDRRIHKMAQDSLRKNHHMALSFIQETMRLGVMDVLPDTLVHRVLAHKVVARDLLGNIRPSEVGHRVIQEIFELVEQTPGLTHLEVERVSDGGTMRLYRGKDQILAQDIASGAFHEIGQGTMTQTRTHLEPQRGWKTDVPGGRDVAYARGIVRAQGGPIDAFIGMGEGRIVNYDPANTFRGYGRLRDDIAKGRSGRPVISVDWETTGLTGQIDDALLHPTSASVHSYKVDGSGLKHSAGHDILFKPNQAVEAKTIELATKLSQGGDVAAVKEAELWMMRNIAKFTDTAWANPTLELKDIDGRKLATDTKAGLRMLQEKGVNLAEGIGTVEKVLRSASRQRGVLVGQNYADADHIWHTIFRERAANEALEGWHAGLRQEAATLDSNRGRGRYWSAHHQRSRVIKNILRNNLSPEAALKLLNGREVKRGNASWFNQMKGQIRGVINLHNNLPSMDLVELMQVSRLHAPDAASHALPAQAGRTLGAKHLKDYQSGAHLSDTDAKTQARVLNAYLHRPVQMPSTNYRRLQVGDHLVRTNVGFTIGLGGTEETGRQVRQAFRIHSIAQQAGGTWRIALEPLSGGRTQLIEGRSQAELARHVAKEFAYTGGKVAQAFEEEFIYDDATRLVRKASYNLRSMLRLVGEGDILRRIDAGGLPEESTVLKLQQTYREAYDLHTAGKTLTPAQEAVLMSVNDMSRMDEGHALRPYMRDIFHPEERAEDLYPFRGARQRQALEIATKWAASAEGQTHLHFLTELSDLQQAGFLGRGQAKELLREYNEGKKEIAARRQHQPRGLVHLGVIEGRNRTVTASSADRVAQGLYSLSRSIEHRTNLNNRSSQSYLLGHLHAQGLITVDTFTINRAAAQIYTGVGSGAIPTGSIDDIVSPLSLGGVDGEQQAANRIRQMGNRLISAALGGEVYEYLMAGDTPIQPVDEKRSMAVLADRYRRIREARAGLPQHRAIAVIKGRSTIEGSALNPFSGQGDLAMAGTQEIFDQGKVYRTKADSLFAQIDQLNEQIRTAHDLGKDQTADVLKAELNTTRGQAWAAHHKAKLHLQAVVGRAKYENGAIRDEARAILGWDGSDRKAAMVGSGRHAWGMVGGLNREQLNELAGGYSHVDPRVRQLATEELAGRVSINRLQSALANTPRGTLHPRTAVTKMNEATVEKATERAVQATMAAEAIQAEIASVKRAGSWKTMATVGIGVLTASAIVAGLMKSNDNRKYVTPGGYDVPNPMSTPGPRPLPPQRAIVDDGGVRLRVRARSSRPVADNSLNLAVNGAVNDGLGIEAQLNVNFRDDRRSISNEFVSDLFSQLVETGYVTSPQ